MRNTRTELAKKILMGWVLTMMLVLSLSCVTFAAKTKTVNKKITLDQGVKTTVSAGAKASWKSGSKGILSVKVSKNKKKATIKALRAGKTTVTATVGGGKKKIVWKVNVSASASGSTGAASSTVADSEARMVLQPSGTAGMTAFEAAAYQTMLQMSGTYAEGMVWPNSAATYYAWKGGIWRGGYGCASFAFRLSDAAFGERKAKMIMVDGNRSNVNDVIRSWMHVGDIIRTDSDGMRDAHSVVVMKKTATGIVVAEGNYGGKVHWGRMISYKELTSILCYVVTRYDLDESGNILA